MESLFDGKAFGEFVRSKRKSLGLKSAKTFCEKMQKKTGFMIHSDTLLMVERGERLPSMEAFFAICAVLRDGDNPSEWGNEAIGVFLRFVTGKVQLLNIAEQLNSVESCISGIRVKLKKVEGDVATYSALYVLCEREKKSLEGIQEVLEDITPDSASLVLYESVRDKSKEFIEECKSLMQTIKFYAPSSVPETLDDVGLLTAHAIGHLFSNEFTQ